MDELTVSDELIGKKFGKLKIKEILSSRNGGHKVKCVCECGKEKDTRYYLLRTGNIKSCGCSKGNKKGFDCHSKLYKKRYSMLDRCNNPKNLMYHRYGGRGIKVCKQWQESFEEFRVWAFSNGYKEGLSLERINNDGDYCPENCKWIELIEQSKNKDQANLSRVLGKEVLQIDLETGRVIAIFPSVKSAERYIGVKGIYGVIRGKSSHAGGYKWKFADMKNEHKIRSRRKKSISTQK